MTSPRLPSALVVWALFAVFVRVLATLFTQHLGFAAISDDDFARVEIAQRFAQNPRWDASGTSWLPFPFWLTGGVMMLSSPTLGVARALAWATSIASVLGFMACGHAVGLRGRWKGLVTCFFAALPHAVWLGVATVPEGMTAVLVLAGLVTLRGSLAARWVGAASLLAATLCRYETWPIAVVVGCHYGWDGWRRGWRSNLGAWALTLGSLLGPGTWVLHGALNHGDGLFFVKRVASYRAALGVSAQSWLSVLGNYPRALLSEEPLVALLCVSALVLNWRARANDRATPGATPPSRAMPSQVTPLLWGAAALVGFLVWGDVINGAPTHHPERALLPVWLVGLLVGGRALQGACLLRKGERPSTGSLSSLNGLPVALFASTAIGSGLWWQHEAKHFVDRSHELALGEYVAAELLPNADMSRHVFVETRGYGYVAVAVGSAKPWCVEGYNPEDPRQAAHGPPWENGPSLAAFFAERKVAYAVVPPERDAALRQVATPTAPFGSSLIFRFGPP